MHARQAMCDSELFGEDFKRILAGYRYRMDPIPQMFDNTLEFLMLSGRSLAACRHDDGSRALVQA